MYSKIMNNKLKIVILETLIIIFVLSCLYSWNLAYNKHFIFSFMDFIVVITIYLIFFHGFKILFKMTYLEIIIAHISFIICLYFLQGLFYIK